jgi:predicted RNA-binding protein with PUA-like domain
MGRFRWVAGQRFDASDLTGKFGMVDIRAVKALKRPVTLAAIRANPGGAALAGPLARNFECLMDLLYSS